MISIAPQTGGTAHVRRHLVAGVSLVSWAGLALCYAFRPDAAAAVTLFPAWLWVVPGLLLAPFAGRRWRGSWLLAGAWVVFLLLFAEEPWSLLRADTLSPRRDGDDGSVRVVSLNCAGGSAEAANEVAAWDPDVVLLQEVPAEGAVRALAARLYGSRVEVVYGYDTAVLSRGLMRIHVPPREHRFFVAARIRYQNRPVEVISLRLTPPVVRMDLWSPACWAEQTANRRARREQVAELRAHLDGVPPEVPLIVGGDFNAPGGDAVGRMLEPRLRDAFIQAGAGWGNTGLNDIPVSRVDQIWTNDRWRPRKVVARRTRHSDHRMVVAELEQ